MIELAVQELNNNLTATWVTRKEGIVYPVKSDEGKIYPFSLGTTSCTRDNAVTPDSDQSGILYWEDRTGTTGAPMEGDSILFKNTMRLVGWMNYRKIGVDETTSPVNALKLKAENIRGLIEQIHMVRFTHTAGQVRAKFVKELPKDVSIFSRYSYDKGEPLFYPFDFFALEFELEFTQNCTASIVLGGEVC